MSFKVFMMQIGIWWSVGLSVLFYWVFLMAYFNPTKKVIMDINAIGEAHVEMVLLLIVMPIIVASAVYAHKRIIDEDDL
jgi:hypothetical protein